MIKAQTDVTRRLLKTGIDVDSLCEVLQNHFLRSSGSSESLGYGDQDSPTILIHWTQTGAIKKIVTGKDIDAATFAKIESEIDDALRATDIQYRRFPIFSNRPVKGAIGFEDWFQIIPAPDSVPQPTAGWGDYVAVLEVAVEGSSLSMLVGNRAFTEAKSVELLLSGLTLGGFRLQSQFSQSVWVLDPEMQGKPRHLQRGFSSQEMHGTVPSFADIGGMSDIELVSVHGYFDGRSQGSSEHAILPETFPGLALKFRTLSKKRKDMFLRAARWAKHMDDVSTLSRSAAYVAAISAIEALLPSTNGPATPCAACGRTKVDGLTQQFANFVDSMVGGAVPYKLRLALYNRRSRIVHGQLIASDDVSLHHVNPTSLSEMSEQRWLNASTRIVLHNWLVAEMAQ